MEKGNLQAGFHPGIDGPIPSAYGTKRNFIIRYTSLIL
jgi:hypothetical protein